MKRKAFVFFTLFFIGFNCFAQSAEARTRALQGEWLIIKMDDVDFSIPPYSEIIEAVWIFDGNTYLLRSKNLQDGNVDVESGTFKIISDAIILSHQDGVTQTCTYTLVKDILTIKLEGSVMVFRKR